jgi:hypothetical protein
MRSIFLVPFSWPVFGLIGGIAIDRRWGKSTCRAVAFSIFATAVLYSLGLWLGTRPPSLSDVLPPVWVALGWGSALMVCESAKFFVPKGAALRVTSEKLANAI